MSLPVGVPRRAFSYDDALEDTAPMTPPPADLCANVLWKQPVIPERKYQELSKVRAGPLPPWLACRCRPALAALGPGPDTALGLLPAPPRPPWQGPAGPWEPAGGAGDKRLALLPGPVVGSLKYG